MNETFQIKGEANIIFHHRDHRLHNIFTADQILDTRHIFVSTYNFNFLDKSLDSPYDLLKKAAMRGVIVTLVYASEFKDSFSPDEEFRKLIKCIKLKEKNLVNHSKIIILDSVAYIGSANFSKGSENNYECGTLLHDKKDIRNLRELFKKVLIVGKKENYKRELLGLEMIDEIESLSGELSDLIEEKKYNKHWYIYCINEIVESKFNLLEDIYGVIYKREIINNLNEIKEELIAGAELSDIDIDELQRNLDIVNSFCCDAINHVYYHIQHGKMMDFIERHYR
ncbi:phospholipase D-like domain-containing protein [Bacillus cereus]|uniref:phospholipase D-like domain-containing protein n=1 Tax=Bacillus cereus TaxID=1396 RepID=UPI0039C0CFDE